MRSEADQWWEDQQTYILSRDAQYNQYDKNILKEHTELKEKVLLKNFELQSGLTCFAKGCIFLIPLIGYFLELEGVESAFANSGGIMVIIAAFVAIYSSRQESTIDTLMNIELERNLRYAMYLEFRNRMPFQQIATYPISEELKPLQDIYSGKQTKIRKMVKDSSMSLRYLEPTLLFLGTIIWALGSYV